MMLTRAVLLLLSILRYVFGMTLEYHNGVNLIYEKDRKLLSADVLVSENIYFIILQENGKSLLKTLNFTKFKSGEVRDFLQYPVQSAESLAVDWLNRNLYWADKTNRFIEVVDLSHGLDIPISRHRRRILFTREMADIYSIVVDPREQYLFWLQIGADMVLERARLDGTERRVIYRSIQYKSSRLAIDRHRKMLFWWGIEGVIHRVDYQGQTGCSMQLQGEWKHWMPSFLTFTDGRLLFINEDRLWITSFICSVGLAVVQKLDRSDVPCAIIAGKHQFVVTDDQKPSPCVKNTCTSICLPTSDSQHRCTCMTGIDVLTNSSVCPLFPSRSLIIASPPQIYHISLDSKRKHLEPLFENSGIPFQLAYDSTSNSLLYLDYNSSSIFSLNLSDSATPRKLVLDFPIFSQIPASFDIDPISRNIYWMNRRSSEVWVARISPHKQLNHAALLLCRLPNSPNREPTGNRLPGEMAVDSINRYLFITIIGDKISSIERYWLDGSHKFSLISSPNIITPRGFALDNINQKLFFVESAWGNMISIDYQGKNMRIIASKISDLYGLTYIDDFIYWIDIDTASVNMIRSDGTERSSLVTAHNHRVPSMPIIAISRDDSTDDKAPCRVELNKCDQLCFPTRMNHDSYSCGCSNPAHILLYSSRCSHSSKSIFYYNISTLVTFELSPVLSKTVTVLGKSGVRVGVMSLQMDHFRNHIYWINEATNCIMRTTVAADINTEWRLLCLTSDKLSSIGLDIVRNNLYVAISSSIWSRIQVIRLPFPNSDISRNKVIASTQNKNRILGSVTIHSSLKYIFWIESEEERLNFVDIYQSYLDGSSPTFIWSGNADLNELVVDESANHIYWKSSEKGKIFKYDILTKEKQSFQVSWDILHKVRNRPLDWLHIYPAMESLYISVGDSIFYINSTDIGSTISFNRMKLVLRVDNMDTIKGLLFNYRTPPELTKKVAFAKTDDNVGDTVMCPNTKTDVFVQCSQFCLPTLKSECGCGSMYSLNSDGTTCTDSNDNLMIMTNVGEIIGIRVNVGGKKSDDINLIEWVEVPGQSLIPGQKFIDAVYWLSRNIVLRLDNHGYLSATDPMRPFVKTRLYKQLSIQEQDGNATRYSSSYEKIYKHFLEKDAAFKDQYDSSRFSLAIDPISDVLMWSDWVNGIIVAEKLHPDRDKIEFLGVILDFRHSSRRPLQIAIAPISSSLIWLSADLALSSSNVSSIWRQFWIEISDLDGSRRSVLVRDPGIPSCLTVDMHSGRVYWIDSRTNKLMYLHVHWDNYQLRAGHVFGQNMRVSIHPLLSSGVGSSTSTIVVLKKYLFWTDWFQKIVASSSLNGDVVKPYTDFISSDKIQFYNLRYLKHKLKNVVRLIARVSVENFKISSLGTLLQNHPCSFATQTTPNQRCSHLCLSTLPISLAEEYSFMMTTQQLAGKFRCSCPLSMAVKPNYYMGVCVKSQFIKCDKHQILCRAGQVFTKREGMTATSCMPVHQQCDLSEDCLDGSDETGCNTCNNSHSYSCSGSGMCIPLHKRCDGVADCESDEQCCGNQRYECLSGMDATRCLTTADRCNGIRDCIDGSDEHKCHSIDVGQKGERVSSTDDQVVLGHLNNNHTVAIIAGTVAISACSIAIIYICLSRRNHQKTVHESCLFRANNVNIMFMSPTQRPSRSHRFNKPYQRPGSVESLYHAKSCDIVDNSKQYDRNDPSSQSLTSLSECYRRIKNPQPSTCSALGRPLFSMHDDILFQLSRIRKRRDLEVSDASIEKLSKPHPSVVSINSVEVDKPDDVVSRNSPTSSLCESELEEIYVHRYQFMRRPPALDNYPSCLLQNLLSACNQTSQLHTSPTIESRDLIVENVYRRRRRKLFKYRNRCKSSRLNPSLSSSRTLRPINIPHDSDLCLDSSSNLHISPPPPSPITVVSV